MKNPKGSVVVLVIVILIIIVVVGAGYWYWVQKSSQSTTLSNGVTSFQTIATGSAPATSSESADLSRIRSDYLSDGTTIFFVSHGVANIMPEADVKTFLVLDTITDANPWGLDKNHVYYSGQIIPGADPATFKLLDGFDYGEDNHAVYWQNQAISGVDLRTFVAGNSSNGADYGDARDKNHIYCSGTAYSLTSTQCTPPAAMMSQ